MPPSAPLAQVAAELRRRMIAEAAYFRAEEGGFNGMTRLRTG